MLRIIKFLNRSTTEIQVGFNVQLDDDIGIQNVSVKSNTLNIPDLAVRSVRISGRVISIEIDAQQPEALYFVEFKSTGSQSFQSAAGDSIKEDGLTNRFFFVGLERTNDIRDTLIDDGPPTYDLDTNTLPRKFFSMLGESLLRARTDIRQTGNANYLSEEIRDEIKERGFGPTDRLANEGVYEVLRASTSPEGELTAATLTFKPSNLTDLLSDNSDRANTQVGGFPSDPVSLRSRSVTETVSNAEQLTNKFEGLIVTVANDNVARLNSLTITAGGDTFVYDLPEYGYNIQNNRYDTVFGRQLVTLESNQFRLSQAAIIAGNIPEPSGGDTIEVNYTYIDNGRNVDEDNESRPLSVIQTANATREPIGPLLTIFSLQNFPIINSLGKVPTSGGVQFLDPRANPPFSSTHPAFINEIPFSASKLPSARGEYSVDYSTGQVFVYGASIADGTGRFPPVATYTYRRTFTEGIDYNVDRDADEIVAVPNRDLVGEDVEVRFAYEQVFAPGVDYLIETHKEVADELVGNRLSSSFSIVPQNRPITNVFRVFNETTGETYRVSRFNNNEVFIAGNQLPRINNIQNESVTFASTNKEDLFITDTISTTVSTKIVAAELQNEIVTSEFGQHEGANVNSSLRFSDTTLFQREFFYDNVLQTLAQNLTKLTSEGDYMVDYQNGIVYLFTDIDQPIDLGEVNYSYGTISTTRTNVFGVNGVNYRRDLKSDPILNIAVDTFNESSIALSGLQPAVERFLNGNSSKPILLGAVSYGVLGRYTPGSTSFVSNDAVFTSDLADGYHILRIEGDFDRTITSVVSQTEVTVDIAFGAERSRVNWCIIDFNFSTPAGDGYKTITTYDPKYVRGVYTVTDLQTNDRDSLTNLYDPSTDTISANTINFTNANMASVAPGTALAIDYSFGVLYTDYDHVLDSIRVTYEHGDNSLNWSISNALNPGDEYFVSYRYGALRNALTANFASLTQLQELVTVPLDFDRELYRDFLIGTLQGFVEGPTPGAISTLVESVTKIEPSIRELSFNEWTVGRDNLYLDEGEYVGTPTYDSAKYGNGLVFREGNALVYPAEAYFSHREGTYQAWTKPFWSGLDNDATLTFFITEDGYGASVGDGYGIGDGYNLGLNDIYIGASAWNPTTNPFQLSRFDAAPQETVGRPANYGTTPGMFIWFSDSQNKWFVSVEADPSLNIAINGEITTSGEFYNVRDSDGYKLEVSDSLTSTRDYIRFQFQFDGYEISDGYDGYVGFDGYTDGYFYQDEISFLSDNVHYLVDTGPSLEHNRMAIYKDGSGFLNLRVWDDTGNRRPGHSKFYNISHDIQGWVAEELHFISASWCLNSAEGVDELHLFVDGQEVSNVFKYGGRPQTTPSDVYRTIAEEVAVASAASKVIGGADGISVAGSSTFTSSGSTFISDGITAGDTLDILDATTDGSGSPYSITAVPTETTLTLGSALTLSLNNISFSVNKTDVAIETRGDVEDIAVFAEDGYGVRRELHGLEATQPDYSISRSEGQTTLSLLDNVDAGDTVVVHTLGLTQGRCRDLFYKWDDDNTVETRLPPPTSLDHFDVYKVLFPRTSIEDGNAPAFDDGYFDGTFILAANNVTVDGYFTGICQPSNTTAGKRLAVTIGGNTNMNFSATNEVIIGGTTFAGPTSETLSYTQFETQTTTNFFTSIDYIDMEFTAVDGYSSLGSIEISESVPLTVSENSGDYAQVVSYANGQYSFDIFGSGGLPFNLQACYYRFDYPLPLNIPMSKKGDLYIGSDLNGENSWNGVVEQVGFLNERLEDVRIGEDKSAQRTVTSDFNSPVPLTPTPQTLMLLDTDNKIENVQRLYKTFQEGFLSTSRSVNSDFGDAAVFTDRPFVIDNGSVVFNNNEASFEFWVSPLIDTQFDDSNTRYYVDIAALSSELVVSTSKRVVELPSKAKRVNSVRLLDDTGDGTNYFDGGELFVDGTTVFLGQNLPGGQTTVRVEYVPIDFSGDRVSIFKDGYGYINFAVVANEELFKISYPVVWERNTWHRVMATLKANTIDGTDRMRLFIDGVESGTITYGTPGLLYGSGVIYGSSAVGSLASDFLTSNIDLTDTFGEIYIGNSFDGQNPSKSKIDNLRISNEVRAPSVVSGSAVDLNFNSNRDAVAPVVEDGITTALYNFNSEAQETEFLSNLIGDSTSLFQFDVEIDDSFRRVLQNPLAKSLLEQIIRRMKPAHANVLIKYLQEE